MKRNFTNRLLEFRPSLWTRLNVRLNGKKQKAYYSGKKKNHTLKAQVVVTPATGAILCTAFGKGKIHDLVATTAILEEPQLFNRVLAIGRLSLCFDRGKYVIDRRIHASLTTFLAVITFA